jgi:hypothetical protein
MTCAMSLGVFAFVDSRRTVWDWVDLPLRWVEDAPPMIIMQQRCSSDLRGWRGRMKVRVEVESEEFTARSKVVYGLLSEGSRTNIIKVQSEFQVKHAKQQQSSPPSPSVG